LRLRGALGAGWLGAAWLGLAVARPAHAAELALSGPATCNDRDELRFRVERALGAPLAAATARSLTVTIEEARAGLAAWLRIREPGQASTSARRLVAPDCAALMEALSVVIALAAERTGAGPAALNSPQRTPPPNSKNLDEPVASLGATDAPLLPSAVPEGSAPWALPAAFVALTGDMGSLPQPALGVGLGFALDGQRLRLQASGLWFVPQRTGLAGQSRITPGAEMGLGLGALEACYAPSGSWRARSAIGACVRSEAGWLFGRGRGVPDERSGGRLWLAPGVSLAGGWRLGAAWHLGGELGAELPLVRSEFRLGTLGALYRPAAVAFRLGLGVGFVID
jgi:hypothetical protein